MTDSQIASTRRSLAIPRAAAVAGILFGLLYSASVTLIRLAIPEEATADSGVWLETNSQAIRLALNLIPYAGIAFLWFIGVIRDPLGDVEDRFFATILLRSGLMHCGWALLTWSLAMVLLVMISSSLPEVLIFPMWVLAVGDHDLFRTKRDRPQGEMTAGAVP